MKKLLIVVLVCLLSAPLFAQVGTTAAKPEAETPATPALSALQTAYALASYGYKSDSASALICAAEIIAQTQTQAMAAKGAAKDETADATKKAEKPEYTAEKLLADGKKLAAGDKTVLAYAAAVEKAMKGKTRGAVGGPRYQVDRVGAGGTVTYTLAFEANKLAEVLVVGDGDTDLDLYIFDQNGNLIVYDEGYSDNCYVRFVPKWTGNFIIVVKNRGRVYNRFQIATN
ncbi:hypothetical protein [Treponema sp. R8-4-B8]